MPDPHKWQHKFRGHALRWSALRESILELLSSASRHMSAKEIHASLYKTNPNLGLTTVYRTLDLLSQMNFINKITLINRHGRYEFNRGDKEGHHHHLICTQCGKIINTKEFEEDEPALMKKTEENLTKNYNFEIFNYYIDFFGLCSKCQ
jgi:Fur family ferric uptake transcriptional regulator